MLKERTYTTISVDKPTWARLHERADQAGMHLSIYLNRLISDEKPIEAVLKVIDGLQSNMINLAGIVGEIKADIGELKKNDASALACVVRGEEKLKDMIVVQGLTLNFLDEMKPGSKERLIRLAQQYREGERSKGT